MTHDYTFKTYIANGREYYEYSVDTLTWLERSERESSGQPMLIKKDFPFPESLLSLLYLDTDKLGLLVKQIDKAIREFLPSKDERYVHEGLATLDELAEVHVYFELVRLEWRWRFVELKERGGGKPVLFHNFRWRGAFARAGFVVGVCMRFVVKDV